MLLEADHINNTVVLTFRYIQCLHLMNFEVAQILVSLETQVHPQIILDPDFLPDYLSISYDYDKIIRMAAFFVVSWMTVSYKKYNQACAM